MRITSGLVAVLLAFPAVADEVDLELVTTVYWLEKEPRIVVTPSTELKELRLELTRGDGEKITRKTKSPPIGKPVTFELAQGQGSLHYEGSLFVIGASKTDEYPLDFDTAVYEQLLMTFPKQPLDDVTKTARFMVNREDVTVEVQALDEGGNVVGRGQAKFEKQPKGSVLSVPWQSTSKAPIVELEIDAMDPYGFSSKGRVVTWKVEVPHEEVNFDTAKHDLKPSEKPKLDAVLPKLAEALGRYNVRFPGVRFWIAGHTDTVDDRVYNQGLSERRARTIAQYFRAKGVTLPIAYAGFGEEVPLVPTPDETEEKRNRRATYILSVDEPGEGVTWTPIK